jgi:hypothetical protein
MKRFKVIRDRESLSSSEITKQMNFDTFILGYTPATNILLSVKSIVIFGASAISIAIAVIVLMRPPLMEKTSLAEAFIVPPISQFNIPANNLLVSGCTDTIINYPSGTKLFIPANAFIRGDNSLANGPFRISFREFHDQVDQLLSGIPMLYDSAGTKMQFESAGMFDIRAYENDLPVFIKEGKELIVDMQSRNFDNNFNIYYLDTIQKRWIYDKDNSENAILLTAGVDSMLHRKFQTGFESMVLPEKANPLLDNLVIDFDKEEFPELALFDNVKFQFTDKKGNAASSNNTWDDVKITRQNNKHYLVTFAKGKFKQSFVTTPVLDEKDFEKVYTEYDHVRTIRISKFKIITDSLNSLRARYDAQHIQTLVNSNQRINDLIHKGNFQEAANNYIDAESLVLMSKQKGGLSRMIFVRRFGISNADRPFRFANAFSYAKRSNSLEKNEDLPKAYYYSVKNNTKLDVEKAYMIKRNFNGTYTLDKKSISEFPVNEAKGSDILVVVTTKKEMLYIKDKEFKATNFSGSEVIFKMHTISNAKTGNEIKKYLNL